MAEYDEPERFNFFDVQYRATHAEANRLMLAAMRSPEWQRYRVLMMLRDAADFSAGSAEEMAGLKAICTEMVELDVKITAAFIQAVEVEMVQRG